MITQLAGPKGKHNPDRTAGAPRPRAGLGDPWGTLGRGPASPGPYTDGSGELPVAAYEVFSSTELLGRLALERMPGGARRVGTQTRT